MSSQVTGAAGSSVSIGRLRTFILIALVAGVAVFTGVMFTLVQSLSERFGPQVSADLEWRALRGAQELSKAVDLGLVMSDAAMVKEAFGVYAASSDVLAIIAVDMEDKIVASHGVVAAAGPVLAAKRGTLVRGAGYVASWVPVTIEGVQIGKVAVVVSTQRLGDAETVLTRVSRTTLIAGLAGAILGALVILFFTRQVSLRDQQLNDYAHNLERKVDERTRELDERNHGMRLVLDNVAQGFITVDLAGVMANERSAIVDRWFGEPAAGTTFAAYLEAQNESLVAWFQLGLEGIRDGYMPLELCLDQMPRRFTAGARTFDIAYSAIRRGAEVERILVILSDVSEHIIRERGEREQREMVAMFQRITADRVGFDEFVEDAAGLVASLASPGDPLVERRTIHTLKGNCAIYGLESYAERCHEIESELVDSTDPISAAQRGALADGWHEVTAKLARLLGSSRRNIVELEFAELARVIEKAKQGMASRELATVLTSWSHEPVTRRFERLARHATSLARGLGKGDVEVVISDEGIRLDTSRWVAFWSAMVHGVRNAVDHGIEDPAVRALAGKPVRPKLTFRATRARGRVIISMSDDGGGVAWDKVRDRAIRVGLPAASQLDLEHALFADGFSTRDQASETSGRGVGMAALRDAVMALGGTIQLESTAGEGTTLRFQFPEADGQILPLRPPTQPSFGTA